MARCGSPLRRAGGEDGAMHCPLLELTLAWPGCQAVAGMAESSTWTVMSACLPLRGWLKRAACRASR